LRYFGTNGLTITLCDALQIDGLEQLAVNRSLERCEI
jgi:hypothetical protein